MATLNSDKRKHDVDLTINTNEMSPKISHFLFSNVTKKYIQICKKRRKTNFCLGNDSLWGYMVSVQHQLMD